MIYIKYSSWKRTADVRLFLKFSLILLQQNSEIFQCLGREEQNRWSSWCCQPSLAGKVLAHRSNLFGFLLNMVIKKFVNGQLQHFAEQTGGFFLQSLAGDVIGRGLVSAGLPWMAQIPPLVCVVPYQTQISFQLPAAEVFSSWYFTLISKKSVPYCCDLPQVTIWFGLHSDCTTLLFIAESALFFHPSYHAIIFIPCFSSSILEAPWSVCHVNPFYLLQSLCVEPDLYLSKHSCAESVAAN